MTSSGRIVLCVLTFVCCALCVRIFPLEGQTVILTKEFSVKPSSLVPIQIPVPVVSHTVALPLSVPDIKPTRPIAGHTQNLFNEQITCAAVKSLEQIIVKPTTFTTLPAATKMSHIQVALSTTAPAVAAFAPTKVLLPTYILATSPVQRG